MSVFVAIGLVVLALAVVALVILAFDLVRGDLGGGRHTLERARRLLVVATDETTRRAADAWIAEQRREHPRLQCFVLSGPEGQDLYMDVEAAVERERPDAIVLARHGEERHGALEGLYGRLKEGMTIPVDAIYVGSGERP